MWSLPAPDVPARTFYRTCISNARPQTKARLASLEGAVCDAAERFEVAAAIAALHTLADLKEQPEDKAIRGELTKNYTQRTARRGAPGRETYDRIKAAVPYGRCPLCGHRTVETLDHQLPKIGYPLLAVVPANLVPACRSCNTIKGEAVPNRAEEQTLHPYFDDIGKQQWLFGQVLELAPAAIEFFVRPTPGWDDVLTTRVRRHFRTFGLAALYGSQAAQEMSALRHYLKNKDQETVSAHLKGMADSWFEVDRNHWRAAMYQALADSSWYISGGFALV